MYISYERDIHILEAQFCDGINSICVGSASEDKQGILGGPIEEATEPEWTKYHAYSIKF